MITNIIVVDNACTDGTPEAIATHADLVLRRPYNGGSCAKAYGVDLASAPYVVFLDEVEAYAVARIN